jgi:hypothetical protein
MWPRQRCNGLTLWSPLASRQPRCFARSPRLSTWPRLPRKGLSSGRAKLWFGFPKVSRCRSRQGAARHRRTPASCPAICGGRAVCGAELLFPRTRIEVETCSWPRAWTMKPGGSTCGMGTTPPWPESSIKDEELKRPAATVEPDRNLSPQQSRGRIKQAAKLDTQRPPEPACHNGR